MLAKIPPPYVFVATLVIALLGGVLATLMRIPLSWMIGSLLATALANLFLGHFPAPPWARTVGQVTVGVAVGLSFTPHLAARLIELRAYMISTALLSILFGALLSIPLARLTRIDPTTAYFASLPGGVAEMSVLAERFGGDTALVALSQSLRVVLVIITIPAAAAILGWHGEETFISSQHEFRPLVLALMLLAGWFVAWSLGKGRITNNWLLGGLLTGGLIAFFDLPTSQVPTLGLNASQVLIGCALGSRFTKDSVLKLRRFIPATIVSTLILIGLTSLIAVIAASIGHLDVATLVIASAPGGVAEMSLTARTLHVGSAEVTAFHLVRVLLVVLVSAPAFRAMSLLRTWRSHS